VRYLPGIMASVVIIGVAEIPERILMRDMRFRLYGGSVAFGEVVYAATSVALAAMGFGGMAIVIANVTRSSARFIVSLIAVPRSDWLTPATIERQHLKRILGFGTPLLAANVSGHISSRWDNLIVSAMFGPAAMGAYNQAYNLANIPSETLGETAADVLLPSFAQVPVKQRRYAFVEAISLLGLIIFPLALGLGVVARPLVATLFSAKWQGVAPLLALLSFMSVFFPIANACQVFFKAEGRTPLVMKLQITQAILMLGCVWSLGHLGLTWAAAAAGLSSGVTTLAALFAIGKVSDSDLSLRSSLAALARPLVATAAMAAASLGVEHALVSIGARPVVQLALAILVGIAVYVPAAFLLAPEASRKLMVRLSSGLRRG
jgi:PST family polysaccharide transporter